MKVYTSSVDVHISINRPHVKGWVKIDITDACNVKMNGKPLPGMMGVLFIETKRYATTLLRGENVFYIKVTPVRNRK